MSNQIKKRQGIPYETWREGSQERSLMGFTLVEVIAAIMIIGIGITPLVVAQGKTLEKSGRSIVLQKALLVAEKTANEVLFRGYEYAQGSGYQDDEGTFDIQVSFSAEQFDIPEIFQIEEEEGAEPVPELTPEEEEKTRILIYRIFITVTSRDDSNIKVEFKLEMPAETTAIKGTEELESEINDEELP